MLATSVSGSRSLGRSSASRRPRRTQRPSQGLCARRWTSHWAGTATSARRRRRSWCSPAARSGIHGGTAPGGPKQRPTPALRAFPRPRSTGPSSASSSTHDDADVRLRAEGADPIHLASYARLDARDASSHSHGRLEAEVDRFSRLHDADIEQEVEQPRHQRQSVELVEVHPRRLHGVVAGLRSLGRVERRAREVEDDEVVLVPFAAHPLHPPEEPVDDDIDAGLLVRLAHNGLVQLFPQLHPPARERPFPCRRPVAPPDEEDLSVAPHHRADRDLWPVAQPRSPSDRFSTRCMTSARAVNPDSSKKFFAARWPGSASVSTPIHPCATQNATSSSAITSPTPTARASGSTYRSVMIPRVSPVRSCSSVTTPKPITVSSTVPTTTSASSRSRSAP